MSALGPVEPGEGTLAADDPGTPPPYAPGRAAAFAARHRRALLAACCATAVTAGAAYLWATRPVPAPPPPVPWPAQSVSVTYRNAENSPGRPGAFTFGVHIVVSEGPPVTVERIGQPSEALRISSVPRTPFRLSTDKPRIVRVTIQVAECRKVARNAGLPFLDVTLRNTRAIQEQSYILGARYSRDLAEALGTACPLRSPNVR